ncbi:hypothetical protein HID58_056988 [Brassica napus]|uniref:Uncharacterized protein n=1 Tax=Brassica napus TaxID=3708 RepID=A0ABQ8APU1_BRANA|nr:hypothetical protein HID58_056988 [Brassica napus]
MGRGIGTQGVEGLSQTSYVPGFDPSQDKKEEDWWTPMTSVRGSVDNPVKKEKTEMNTAPPPSQGRNGAKEKRFTIARRCFSAGVTLLYLRRVMERIHRMGIKAYTFNNGPTCFNLSVATRVVSAGKWLGNEEMDAVMFIWRVNTTLNRWAPRRVAFMSAMFCLQVDAAYKKFLPNKKAYQLPDFLLGYGRGELPSHGQTDLVWGVDVDRLYFPLFVNVRAGEAMMTRHESRIQEMEDAMCHYEEKTSECIRELRGIKTLFVCCLVMVFLYHIYA